MNLKTSISVPLVFLLLISLAANSTHANNLSFKEDDNLSFNLDQNISGTGYFATYKHILMPDALGTPGRLFNGVESAGRSHGSGAVKAGSRINAESYYIYEIYEDVEYNEGGDPYDDLEDADSTISSNEEIEALYSPRPMSIGSRYYAGHPIVFNSLINDDACIKNRGGLNSISSRAMEAHGLKRAIDIVADYSSTMMKIDDDVTAGHIHIGAIQLEGIPEVEEEEIDEEEGDYVEESGDVEVNIDEDGSDMNGESDIAVETGVFGLALNSWKNPKIILEEDYIGTFHIAKNISFITDSLLVEKEEGWLHCCTGDWEREMHCYDGIGSGKSARDVFDCNCSNTPGKSILNSSAVPP